VFEAASNVLMDNGSLWVNIGDTYWSGKGEHRSGESKQSARRFGLRPQDKKGDGKWCVPKQLLLIPHRLAIEMQSRGWLVRNDNIWVKPNPIPDQVRDRCSVSHEYVFHFVQQRWYYFDKNAVGRATEAGTVLPPLDTWEVPPVRGQSSRHKARFSEELVRIPILTTTPPRGVVLDPFAGSGTSLVFARKHGFRAIGIDSKKEYCDLMVRQLSKLIEEESVDQE
jgi:site-specific DNA-methyltransferase (adenine-specific)